MSVRTIAPLASAGLLLGLVGALVTESACTPAQQVPLRTALEVSACVNEVALRHVRALDDFKDPSVLAVIASEIAVECTPRPQEQ